VGVFTSKISLVHVFSKKNGSNESGKINSLLISKNRRSKYSKLDNNYNAMWLFSAFTSKHRTRM